MTASTGIRISRIAAPITALGPGRRVAVWVQGCTIGCRGCASVDTWDAEGGTARDIGELAAQLCAAAEEAHATGLSITGGEPFQQADAVGALIDEIRASWPGPEPVDVLAFTGYASTAARRLAPQLWERLDVAVAGPYRRDRPSGHPLLGSANQTIETLSRLGGERMLAVEEGPTHLQVTEQDGTLHVVGMPNPGDLDRLRALLAQRGIRLGDVSWD